MKKILFISFLLAMIVAGGCQKDDLFEGRQDNGQFLYLPEGTDFSSLEDSEWEIVQASFGRIHIIEKGDGQLTIFPAKAQDANMSGNIYEFIVSVVDKYNVDLAFGSISSRSGFLSDGEGDYNGPTDCVAYAISGALPHVSYYDANAWLTNRYGNNGVPSDNIQDALSHFGNVEKITPDRRPDIFKDGYIYNAVVIHGAHAVTGFYISGDYIVCKDYQAIAHNGNNTMPLYRLNEVSIYQYK